MKKKIINTIEKTLNKLKINNIYCLLFHNENDLSLIIKNKKKISKIIKQYPVKNFGISVYNERNANNFIRHYNNSFIQFPYNILNDRFFKLKKKSNIFFARSIFLQGLLSEKKINLKDIKINNAHKKYNQYLKKNKLNGVEVAMNYVFLNKKIDYIILGVNSVLQLKKILKCNINLNNMYKNKIIRMIKSLFMKSNIEPRSWK